MRHIESIVIQEEMGFIVQCVEDVLLPKLQQIKPEIKRINYLYGRPAEVNSKITELAYSNTERFTKWPLVALFEPVKIVYPSNGNYPFVQGLELIIAINSETTWDSYKRDQENVKPFLIPIYEELLRQIRLRRNIVCPNPKADLPHSKTIIKGGSLFSNLVDCIQITDLQLKFNYLSH